MTRKRQASWRPGIRCRHRTLGVFRCRREAVTGRTLGAHHIARCAQHPIRSRWRARW